MTAANAAPVKSDPVSVSADTTKGIIRGTAEINATPERVFRALTTAEMADWWGQGVYRTTDYKIDLRPGGSWSCKAINAKGEESTVGGEYITIDPPSLLEYTWKPSWDGFAESRVRFDIEPTSTGSRITLLHTGFTGREQMAQNHAEGWTRVFGWLADYVAAK